MQAVNLLKILVGTLTGTTKIENVHQTASFKGVLLCAAGQVNESCFGHKQQVMKRT